ncbi:MAG: hypothetical protein RL033_6813 [Pseudomonadota bacterium]|jgi:hydrophobe/amphiphile efflux-3 (HAE3) family protein
MNIVLGLIQLWLRHRVIAGLLLLASIGVSLYAARSIEVRFQYKDFYSYEGNPRLPLLEQYSKEFGDPGGFVVLLLESPDVFSNEVLQYIDSVTRQLEAREEFGQVHSLTNTRSIRAVGDEVDTGKLVDHLPLTDPELEQLRSNALSSSLLVRRVIAPDSTATAVLAEMRTPAAMATIPQQQAAVEAVARVMHSTPPPPGVRIQVTGAPVVEVETTRALVKDQLTLTPAVFLVLIVALVVTFRSIHGIVLPLAAVSVSLVWTAGVFALLGRPLDIVGSLIPTSLLAYGVVDPIFVYTRYHDKLPLTRTREQAVMEAMRELIVPCFGTSLTTALGFAAFITAKLPTIKYFGITVGVGVMFAFLTTITVLPLLLVSVGPSTQQSSRSWLSVATDTLMHRIWNLARSRPELMVGLALSLLIAGIGAARGLSIDNEYVGVLPKGRVQDGVRVLEDKLSGVIRVVAYLEGAPDSMKDPAVLRAIEAVDHYVEQQPVVTSSVSLADLVSDTNRAFFGGDPKEQRVPESAPLISQYLALVDPGDLSDFVNSDFTHSHIRILISDRGSKALWQLRDGLQRELDAHFPALGIKATITGYGVVAYHDLDEVVMEVLFGFVLAFGIILLVQLAMFRSLRIALISVIPNVVPIGACFVVMRLMGLNLRVDNSLLLCVSVGGLFNTTIHIVARVVQQVRTGLTDPDVVVGRALETVGPPSLYTAVILSLGFSAMMLSRFPGLQMLGLLCMVALLIGFAADAMLTTTFIKLFFNWGPRARTASSRPPPRLAVDEEAVP